MTGPVKSPFDTLALAFWSARAVKAGTTSPLNAVTLFAAHMTGNNVEDFLASPTDIRFRDGYFAAPD
jgi:hypothetical protein